MSDAKKVDRKLSILLFGTQMAIGGAQKVLLEQARWFFAHGHSVTAAFFYDKQGLHERWQNGLDFPLLTLTQIDSGDTIFENVWHLTAGLVKLWILLRDKHVDVIETFTYDSNLLALPMAWLAGVPVRLATHHGMIEGFPDWTERLHAWIINMGIASMLVSVSGKTRQQAVQAGIQADRITVIPNGIPLPIAYASDRAAIKDSLGFGGDGLLMVSVGRLVYQKGHEFLVQAMPRVLRAFPDAKVVICGDGSLRSPLERQIMEMGLWESIKLPGNRNDIPKILGSADVFVLPSRWEGLPVALLEAMGAGLPVVATRVEGVDEVIENGVQGWLVPPEDAEALANALLKIADDAHVRQTMGKAARKRIEQFYTVDVMCEKYLQVMLSLERSAGRGATNPKMRTP